MQLKTILIWGLWMVISSRRFPHTWLHACVTSEIGIKGIKTVLNVAQTTYVSTVIRIYNCHVFILLLFIALFFISSFLGGLLPTFKNPMVESRKIILMSFVLLLFYVHVSYMESTATRLTSFPERNLRLTDPLNFQSDFSWREASF